MDKHALRPSATIRRYLAVVDKFFIWLRLSPFALLTVGFVIQFQKPVIIGVRAGIDVNIFRLNPAKRIFR